MSWLDRFLGGSGNAEQDTAAAARMAEWQQALASRGTLPSFVDARLKAAAAGKAPWVATVTPAELAMARRHGIRPIAMVCGTCWYHYGYSWTQGHVEGWAAALARLRAEAVAAGANAVVDVKLRTMRLDLGASMDFTAVGTAVKIDGLPESANPVIATVPALEFVRLLRSGIVPTGIAVGAEYNIFTTYSNMAGGGLFSTWQNQPLPELSQFWENIRRQATRELHLDAKRQGNGVLAHTHFGQLLELAGENPRRYLGRHIVIGTVIHTRNSVTDAPIDVRTVVDMRDDDSPLLTERPHGHNAFPVDEEGGPI
jgi:hypothetical protein